MKTMLVVHLPVFALTSMLVLSTSAVEAIHFALVDRFRRVQAGLPRL